jgi:hypothetical protein
MPNWGPGRHTSFQRRSAAFADTPRFIEQFGPQAKLRRRFLPTQKMSLRIPALGRLTKQWPVCTETDLIDGHSARRGVLSLRRRGESESALSLPRVRTRSGSASNRR